MQWSHLRSPKSSRKSSQGVWNFFPCLYRVCSFSKFSPAFSKSPQFLSEPSLPQMKTLLNTSLSSWSKLHLLQICRWWASVLPQSFCQCPDKTFPSFLQWRPIISIYSWKVKEICCTPRSSPWPLMPWILSGPESFLIILSQKPGHKVQRMEKDIPFPPKTRSPIFSLLEK